MLGEEEEHLFTGRFTNEAITLWIGAPGPDTLQLTAELHDKASRHRLDKIKDGAQSIFQYGPALGYKEYLSELSKFLTAEYKDGIVSTDSLVLTCGATNGLHLAATTLMSQNRPLVAFVECPTYFIALNVLKKDLHFDVVPVSMESDGVNVDQFEEAVKREYAKREATKSNDGKFWALFYTIPTFQNPSGIVQSPGKSQRIIEIARKYDVLVFCDDVYNLLYFNGEKPPKRLLAYDEKTDGDYDGGRVISNGTFSKILGPGIRIGWIESGPRIVKLLDTSGVLASGGSLNNVMSGTIASALSLGLQSQHVGYLRQLYHDRLSAMVGVFDNGLPDGFQYKVPNGGYFLWITGPEKFDAKEFGAFIRSSQQTQILHGSACTLLPESPDLTLSCANSFRLSFAYYNQEILAEGASKVCKALVEFQKSSNLKEG